MVSAVTAGAVAFAAPAGASDAGVASGGLSASQIHAHLSQHPQVSTAGAAAPSRDHGQRTAAASGVGEPLAADMGCGKNASADMATQTTVDTNPNEPGNQTSRTGSGPVTWTVTVTNNGPATCPGSLSNTLPDAAHDSGSGLTVTPYFVTGTTSAGTTCQFPPRYAQVTGQKVDCTLPDLGPGDTATMTFEVVLSHSQVQATPDFEFTDSATVSSNGDDSDSSNDTDSASATYRIR
jgi:hypothetical protein